MVEKHFLKQTNLLDSNLKLCMLARQLHIAASEYK